MHDVEETTKTIQLEKSLVDDEPLKKKGHRIKNEDSQNEEPLFKQGLKLRKTEIVKRPIQKAAVEVPKLKHHAFENVPQDVMEEKHSDIKLSRLLPQLNKKKKKKLSPKETEEEHHQVTPVRPTIGTLIDLRNPLTKITNLHSHHAMMDYVGIAINLGIHGEIAQNW